MSVNCERSNMKTLLVLGCAFLLVAAVANSDALSCTCSDCNNGGEGTCTGDICYSKVTVSSEPGGQPVHTHGCYYQSQAHLCNSSSAWQTTRCCEEHLCNERLQPTLPQPVPPSTSPSSQSSPSCYQSDSSRSSEVRLCSLELFCYSTLRRTSSGTVIYRQGCTSSPCVNETRNRKIKRCCVSSLCNSLIPDPLQEQGGRGTTTPTPTSSTQTTPPQSPSTHTTSQPVTPYIPPILIPNVTSPTNSLPTAPSSTITCHCDFGRCDSTETCTTDVACATLYRYSSSSMQDVVSVSKFCLVSAMGCGTVIGTDFLACCNGSYCNNFELTEAPPLTSVRPTREIVEWTTDGDVSHVSTSQATPIIPSSSPNYDTYFVIGIGIFVTAGIILVIVVMVTICYCCWTRYQTPNKPPTKKTLSTESMGRVELAVGSSLSFPSPNIFTKRRECSSVSTDATSSSRPISTEIPRTSYSNTSV